MEEVSAFAVYKITGINSSSKKPLVKKITKRKLQTKSNQRANGKGLISKTSTQKRTQKAKPKTTAKITKSLNPEVKQTLKKLASIERDPVKCLQTELKNEVLKKNKKQSSAQSWCNSNELKPSEVVLKAGSLSTLTKLPIRNDSIKDATKLFKWLVSPIEFETFFEKFWEKTPCLIERQNANYFSKLISFDIIDTMLINNHIEFTKNIDITSYKNGIRETLNPEGRAIPPVVWDHYANGCSIRLLNPQTYIPAIFAMNTSLQELFHCMVGANVYLTPPKSQGFAPHYDDIEAFVLQIEGRKRWKLYNPRNENEQLPRYSSENFDQNDIGKPILEKVLKPGDILYFPRGTIHQAFTEPGFHSLHITLSMYQKQSYADLFEKLFPMILQRAIAENVEFRRGLPLNIWRNAGIVYSDDRTRERTNLIRRCRDLIVKSLETIPIDQAIDQLAKKFQHEALPPNISNEERCRTIFGSKNSVDSNGMVLSDYSIGLMSKVRLLRANIMRLVEEDDAIRIYYYVDNSKEYCEYDPNYIEIESECASSVEVLIKSYPEYVAVNELPLDDDEDKKIGIVTALWERGLLMLEKPFNCS